MLPAFSLIIPAYNEAERIGDTVAKVLRFLEETSPESEIIVVDDGSMDATSEIVRKSFASGPKVVTRLLRHPVNHGKGYAVRSGLFEATRTVALFSDADLSTPIEEAPKLLEPIFAGELDVTFGSRALDRRLIGNRQAWYREQGGRLFNLLVRIGTGLPYWDTQCGFKAFRLDVFRRILQKAQSDGFGFDVELLYLAERAGLRLREIPVHWNHCEGSKVRFVPHSLQMLREIVELRRRPVS